MQTLYFCPVVSSSFSSPNLSRRRLDLYHTSTHGVALVRISDTGLKRARWKYRTQRITRNLPSAHHRTTLSGYIFATKAHIDNQKKLVKQQYLLQMSPQYGELQPTSGWYWSGTLGHPSVTARYSAVGVSEALRRWAEGATYIWQGSYHVGHWPTF